MRRPPAIHDILLVLFAAIVLVAAPDFLVAQRQQDTADCKRNLKNIATGLELYSCDYGGRFPPALNRLAPNYLVSIPTCPAADRDTYSAGYQSGVQPDFYHLTCHGHHHPNLPPNLPEYDTRRRHYEQP